jgi:hypothetical protein
MIRVPDPRVYGPPRSGFGFDDLKLKKIYNWKFLFLFSCSKISIYLSLGLHKGRPSYRRSLQLSKEINQENSVLFYIFMGLFCPPGSGSGSSNSI